MCEIELRGLHESLRDQVRVGDDGRAPCTSWSGDVLVSAVEGSPAARCPLGWARRRPRHFAGLRGATSEAAGKLFTGLRWSRPTERVYAVIHIWS
jgi:hypothetical protein